MLAHVQVGMLHVPYRGIWAWNAGVFNAIPKALGRCLDRSQLSSEPSLLHLGAGWGRANAFDRGDDLVADRSDRQQTRAYRIAVDMDRGSAASAMPQPNLVPVIPSTSRKTQSSGMSSGASKVTLRPLMVRVVMRVSTFVSRRPR